MKKMIAVLWILLGALEVNAYVSGSAPWCMVDNVGNMQCYYWSYSFAVQSCRNSYVCVDVVMNPDR